MKLLWNEEGRIECAQHAPYRGSDSWVFGRWRPIRPCEAVDFAAEIGRPPRCETCMAIERRAAEKSA
jgi:hypothetical protein